MRVEYRALPLIRVLALFILVLAGCPDDPADGNDDPGTSDVPTGDTIGGGDVDDSPLVCTTNAQCAGMPGVGGCSEGVCDTKTGECALYVRPNCCATDDDCDDGDTSTTDACDQELSVCTHTGDVPCQTDIDCDPGLPCVTFSCDQVCTTWQKPGCCISELDCDDGDSCTKDSCVDFACVSEPSTEPLCCGDLAWSASFAGTLDGFDIETNDQAVLWHLSEERSHSPGGALRFADPVTGSYENPLIDGEIPTSFGRATTPPILLPSTDEVTLSFWVWMDLNELEVEYDLVYLELYSSMGAIPEIWNKGALEPEQYGQWVQMTVDVSSWSGQEVRFGFVVDTLDGTANVGEGVYIDDLAVTGGCGDVMPDCESADDCPAPGAPCMEAACVAGSCTTVETPGCCATASDCPPPPPEACLQVECIQSQCVQSITPGCCTTDSQCNDGDPCTEDVCQGGSCAALAIPGCCQEITVLAQSFDDPNGPQGEIQNTNPDVGWRIDSVQAQSAPNALHYGADDGGYGSGVSSAGSYIFPAVSGVAFSPIWFSFSVYLDISPAADVDELQLRLVTQPGESVVIWDKTNIPAQAYGTWVDVTVSSDLVGAYRPQFWFDTIGANDHTGMGVFIDDFRVHSQCETVCDDVNCDDGNPCTIDSCGPDGQCAYEVIDGCGACTDDDDCVDDGDPCTYASCFQGQCLYIPDPGCNPCNSDLECEDGDMCTENFCNSGQCVTVVLPDCNPVCDGVADCDDDDECTADFCVEGLCEHLPVPGCVPDCQENSDCDDGDMCTSDFCVDGECQNLAIPGCGGCTSTADCADDDPCTVDACLNGVCVNTPDPDCGCTTSQDCEDDDPCTNALCIAGQCVGATIPDCCVSAAQCDDGDGCTADFCEGDQCVNLPIPGCDCFDDQCDDGNPCTTDECGPNGECVSQPVPGCCVDATGCDDGNPCTTDSCQNNACVSTAIAGCCANNAACNDNNPCTADACVDGQCTTTPVAGCCVSNSQCGDGNPCTVDTCQGNQCVSTPSANQPGCCVTASDCEDGDSCTAHSCEEGVCKTTAVPDCCGTDSDCDDGLACTTNSCVGGSCQVEQKENCCFGNASCADGIACTVDSCNNATGQCQYIVLEGCCFGDTDCDDGNPCTLDVCEGNNYCSHTPIEGCCASAADCGTAGTCEQVKCLANQCFTSEVPGCCATDADCDDGDACTDESCQNGTCSVSPVAGCCTSDADCVSNDECVVGSCNGGVCAFQEDADCCEDGLLLFAAFGSGLGGWTVQGTTDAFWQISTQNTQTPPGALWFGNAATGNFMSSQGASAGRILSPPAAIPASAVSTVLNFSVWIDTEQPQQFDQFRIRLQLPDGSETPAVWNKSAIPASSYGTWVAVKVNLSAYAGQTVRVAFEFDSVDAIDNEGQGVFIDDMTIVASCEEVDICSFDGECDDGQACTADTCVAGSCQHAAIPDCCLSDAQCNDDYVCTTDVCGPGGTCQYEQIPECCQFDGECDDGNNCTANSCTGNQCVASPVAGPGCCATDADCADGDPCTLEACVEFQCTYEADPTDPQCCDESTPVNANFNNFTTQGLTIIGDGGQAKWSVQNKRFFSPPFSLYFGIAGQWNYQTEPPASGQVQTQPFDIPATASSVQLSFRTWLDIEPGGFGDSFRVLVLSGTTLKQHWSQAQANLGNPAWTQVFVDLSEYKGKTIQVFFSFQAAQQPFGGGEGIYLDDVLINSLCP